MRKDGEQSEQHGGYSKEPDEIDDEELRVIGGNPDGFGEEEAVVSELAIVRDYPVQGNECADERNLHEDCGEQPVGHSLVQRAAHRLERTHHREADEESDEQECYSAIADEVPQLPR